MENLSFNFFNDIEIAQIFIFVPEVGSLVDQFHKNVVSGECFNQESLQSLLSLLTSGSEVDFFSNQSIFNSELISDGIQLLFSNEYSMVACDIECFKQECVEIETVEELRDLLGLIGSQFFDIDVELFSFTDSESEK